MILHLIALALTPAEGQNPICPVPGSQAPRPNLTTPGSPPGLSTMKDKLRVAWHGTELVLQKAENLLVGTSFKTPVAALNVLIDVKNVHCHSWHPKMSVDPFPRLLQIIGTRSKTVLTRLFGRLELVNSKPLEAESDAASAKMLAFAEYVQSHTDIYTTGEMIDL